MKALFVEYVKNGDYIYFVDLNTNFLYKCDTNSFEVKDYWKINKKLNMWHQFMSIEKVEDSLVLYPCWSKDIVWLDSDMNISRMIVPEGTSNNLHSMESIGATLEKSYAYSHNSFDIYRMNLQEGEFNKLEIDVSILDKTSGIKHGFMKTSDGVDCTYLRTLDHSSLLFKFFLGDESLEVIDTGVDKITDIKIEEENCWIVDEDANLILWNKYEGVQFKKCLRDFHVTYKENMAKVLPYGDRLIVYGIFKDGTMAVVDKSKLTIDRVSIDGITWGIDEKCDSWDNGNTLVIERNGKDNFLIQLKDGRFCYLDSECNIKVHKGVDISISLHDCINNCLVNENAVLGLESFLSALC